MGTATLQSLHCGLPINESDMKRGCGALYCEDQLLVLCKESYPSDHVGFHDSQYGCEKNPLFNEDPINVSFAADII